MGSPFLTVSAGTTQLAKAFASAPTPSYKVAVRLLGLPTSKIVIIKECI